MKVNRADLAIRPIGRRRKANDLEPSSRQLAMTRLQPPASTLLRSLARSCRPTTISIRAVSYSPSNPAPSLFSASSSADAFHPQPTDSTPLAIPTLATPSPSSSSSSSSSSPPSPRSNTIDWKGKGKEATVSSTSPSTGLSVGASNGTAHTAEGSEIVRKSARRVLQPRAKKAAITLVRGSSSSPSLLLLSCFRPFHQIDLILYHPCPDFNRHRSSTYPRVVRQAKQPASHRDPYERLRRDGVQPRIHRQAWPVRRRRRARGGRQGADRQQGVDEHHRERDGLGRGSLIVSRSFPLLG
jgi:hypothetical protein